ncbi:glycosyltransferase family 92 protein [Microbacterium ureisolvens]|uniref:glycosyltransferase family 92 protein n=1 Tax=Microbacterium ureisolvens TaxID=2781186 RepID=UPI00362A8CFD
MVRVKNEGRFLPEWIAYNIALGFEHFFVYDNGSKDLTRDVLQPFVEQGYVTYIWWPDSPIYPGADLHFFSTYASQAEWVAFLDPDEFVVEQSPGYFRRTLQSHTAPALAINWRYFGSSGHDALPPGLVLDNFTRADRTLDEHVKVIVRPLKVRRLRNPHSFYYEKAQAAKTADGRRVTSSFAPPGDLADASLILNHYVYRSRSDYSRKATQGFADQKRPGEVPRHISRIESEFVKHNDVATLSPPAGRSAATLLRDFGFGPPYTDELSGADFSPRSAAADDILGREK